MNIVILGCGGFIGSHLLDRLLTTTDHKIIGWDPSSEKIHKHLDHPNFTLHQKYVDDADTQKDLRDAVAGSDVVINLAAICNPSEYNTNPISVIKSNLFDVYPIVELCVEYKRWLISFSTSECYGRTLSSYVGDTEYANPDLYELKEDETPLIMGPIVNQRWTYACAKQMVERLVYAHHKEDGLPFTVVRPLNFFGPRMDYIPQRDGRWCAAGSGLLHGRAAQWRSDEAGGRWQGAPHHRVDLRGRGCDLPHARQPREGQWPRVQHRQPQQRGHHGPSWRI